MIDRLSADSRQCAPGTAFFAWRGGRSDARAHIPEALARGASAVLWDPDGFAWRDDWRVPNAPVENLRERAGFLADAYYGQPSAHLWICGVTGTNGKTTCTQWIAAALHAHGERAGVIGTLGSGVLAPVPGQGRTPLEDSAHTTPEALEVHRLLAQMRGDGARAVAMEVSSHALVQARMNGVRVRCALFTNLSHDHLDYHGSMQAYAEAKSRLFEMAGLEHAVLNLDDALGVRLAQRLKGTRVRTLGYSLSPTAIAPGSVDEFVAARRSTGEGAATRIDLVSSRGEASVLLPACGRFNAANALGVLGCLLARGIGFGAAAALLESLPSVPGRMQRLGGGASPLVVVDYAHTPDALDNALLALRPIADGMGGRLVIVFGAGGNRDASKRPLMGAAASRTADHVVLTSDNPRDEAPLAIIEAIRAGVSVSCEVQVDRAQAISGAVAEAGAGDVILIAGKGHERSQEVAGRRTAFSDVDVARAALERRGAA